LSEIRATTISDETGNGPIALTKQHAVKAWCTLSMSGANIVDSFNCSSATDITTGRFTVAFSSSMSDVNYAVTSSAISHADSNVGSNRTSGATSYQACYDYIYRCKQ
jgi:hypothetical protein